MSQPQDTTQKAIKTLQEYRKDPDQSIEDQLTIIVFQILEDTLWGAVAEKLEDRTKLRTLDNQRTKEIIAVIKLTGDIFRVLLEDLAKNPSKQFDKSFMRDLHHAADQFAYLTHWACTRNISEVESTELLQNFRAFQSQLHKYLKPYLINDKDANRNSDLEYLYHNGEQVENILNRDHKVSIDKISDLDYLAVVGELLGYSDEVENVKLEQPLRFSTLDRIRPKTRTQDGDVDKSDAEVHEYHDGDLNFGNSAKPKAKQAGAVSVEQRIKAWEQRSKPVNNRSTRKPRGM